MRTRMLLCVLFNVVTVFAQSFLGNYSGMTQEGKYVDLHAGASSVRIQFYTTDIVRVDLRPAIRTVIDSSLVVIRQPETKIPFTVNESDSMVIVRSSGLQIRFTKYPLRISFYDSVGMALLSEPASGGFTIQGESRAIRFTMDSDDHFYGTGERGNALDKRGLKFTSYNTQIGGYSDSLSTMNLNVPLITTPNGYALYIDNSYRGKFDFGANDPGIFYYSAEGGEISYYFITASSIPEQLRKYTWLTGRQPLPPRWIFGFTQSKNRYVNEVETRGIVRTMREKNFPCDAIVLDLAWFKHMGDISWDTTAWPNHERMINDFLSEGIKTILITEPYIVQRSHNYIEADTNGYSAKDSTGKTQVLEKWWSCGGCNASLLDLTNPKVQEWWWNKHPAAFGTNVAGIWTDLGEPEKHPESMRHYLGSAVKVHNIFNILWAETVFKGFSALRPNERVVNLTRSGFAGIQRYGVLPWSGDVARSFGGLSVQLPMLLNMGMSGIAYHNSDIGGYARNPTTPELYIRWMQYGVFCPVTRVHGAGEIVNGSSTEPWQFGEEAERISRDYLRLRYALLPYNYSLAYQNYSFGMPLARPLFWIDPHLTNESSSYLWGDAFLISPVVAAGERKKNVVFPAGTWVNFWTDEMINGGRGVMVDAPLDRMPVFVKAGSIVPMAPVMEYSDQRPLDTLILHMYPKLSGNGSTHYELYEDDGRTVKYQLGEFALTVFTQEWEIQREILTVKLKSSPSRGQFNGKLDERNYYFEVHNVVTEPKSVTVNGMDCIRSASSVTARKMPNTFFYDTRLRRLTVHVKSRTDVGNEVVIGGISIHTQNRSKQK